MDIDRRHIVLTVAAGLLLSVAIGCGTRAPSDPVQAKARELGIEIIDIQVTGGGNFARLNYRVVDQQKAKRSLQGDVRLGPEGSDRALGIASAGRLGPLRQRPNSSGRPQFMLFTNYEGTLRKGGRAYVVIGDNRIDGIPVI